MGGAIGRKWKKPPRRLGGAVRKKKKEAAEKRMRKVMGRSGEANKRVGVRRKKKENWYKKNGGRKAEGHERRGNKVWSWNLTSNIATNLENLWMEKFTDKKN